MSTILYYVLLFHPFYGVKQSPSSIFGMAVQADASWYLNILSLHKHMPNSTAAFSADPSEMLV